MTMSTTMDAKSLPDFAIMQYLSGIPSSPSLETLSIPDTEEGELTLNISSSWTYCGPLLPLNPSSLPASFYTWAEATVNGCLVTRLLSFLNFVHEFLLNNGLSHYWLTIRATKGSHDFDMPRWHTDDLFFSQGSPGEKERGYSTSCECESKTDADQKCSRSFRSLTLSRRKSSLNKAPTGVATTSPSTSTTWKLTTTLLGPGTLFISPQLGHQARAIQKKVKHSVRTSNRFKDHICLSVRCVGCAMAADIVRTRLAEELRNYEIVQAKSGDCAFFRVGEDEGAVHSEPKSHGDRIFVNVVPGEEVELKGLMGKWGMEYPRAWCVGLPMEDVIEGRKSRDLWNSSDATPSE